jgi:hypothetical protein
MEVVDMLNQHAEMLAMLKKIEDLDRRVGFLGCSVCGGYANSHTADTCKLVALIAKAEGKG